MERGGAGARARTFVGEDVGVVDDAAGVRRTEALAHGLEVDLGRTKVQTAA